MQLRHDKQDDDGCYPRAKRRPTQETPDQTAMTVYIASLPGDARNDDGINLAASINHPVRPGHGIGQWMISSVRWFAISHPSQPTANSCVTHTASTSPSQPTPWSSTGVHPQDPSAKHQPEPPLRLSVPATKQTARTGRGFLPRIFPGTLAVASLSPRPSIP